MIRSYAQYGIRELVRLLPARTRYAISQRASLLKISVAYTRQRTGDSRWRGRLPIPQHAHPLVRQFVGFANQQKTLLREISERAGISPDTISDWRYNRAPLLTNFIAALNVLDLDLAIVHKRSEA